MKLKKIFIVLLLILSFTLFSSCDVNINTDNNTNNNDTNNTEYNVEFISYIDSYDFTKSTTNNKISKPESPKMEGYIFAGWYLDFNYENKFDFNTEISSNIKLYAKWLSEANGEVYNPNGDDDPIVVPIFTITFKVDSTTYDTKKTNDKTGIVEKPTNPTKEGYTFDGWYLEYNFKTRFDFTKPASSDITLYAKFIKVTVPVTTYTVTYRYEDETIINTVTVEATALLQKPTDPVKTGYTFKGWYLKNNNIEYVFNSVITSNLDLYAKFEAIPTNEKLILNYTDSYYDDLNGELDNTFKYKLHELIESTHTNRLSYSQVWNTLLQADADPNKSGSVLCFYTGVSYSTKDNGSTSSGVWNREHVWPKSLGFSNQGHPAHNDCHHLHATEKWINAQRGNSFFGEVTSGSSDSYGNKWTSTLFEPRDEVKGDVARSIFYMVVRYENGDCSCDLDLELVTSNTPSSSNAKEMGNLLTLLKWHYQDPVSTEELNRNNIVYSIQGNKNPFIDHPEFVSYLYTSYVSSYTDISKIEYLID